MRPMISVALWRGAAFKRDQRYCKGSFGPLYLENLSARPGALGGGISERRRYSHRESVRCQSSHKLVRFRRIFSVSRDEKNTYLQRSAHRVNN